MTLRGDFNWQTQTNFPAPLPTQEQRVAPRLRELASSQPRVRAEILVSVRKYNYSIPTNKDATASRMDRAESRREIKPGSRTSQPASPYLLP